METTAGRAWSATASKADSRSAAGATSAAVGLVPVLTLPWAHPNRVRSKPDAKTSPQKNATTIAAPKRAREYLMDIEMTHLLVMGVPDEDSLETRMRRPTVSAVGRSQRILYQKADPTAFGLRMT